MYPVLFQLGPITIYSFGLFMALAALFAAWVVHSELKRYGYNPELASTMVFAAAMGGLIGARLLFIVEEWNSLVWRIFGRCRSSFLGGKEKQDSMAGWR
jgi:phosphatidylglycerol---prolipoprotein diacylglyceryl transferase